MRLLATTFVRRGAPLRLFLCLALLAAALLAAVPRPAAAATTFTVNVPTDLTDPAPGDSHCDALPGSFFLGDQCTLRAAIMEANAFPGAETIILPAGVYILELEGASEDAGATGDLDIMSDVILQGAGAGKTIVDADQLDRLLHIPNSNSVKIVGVTLRNGSGNAGGGIYNANGSTLTLENVAVVANTASSHGGGIATLGALHLINSTVSGNTTLVDGGGIYVSGNSAMALENSTISGNKAMHDGGGTAQTNGAATLKNVTIAANTADADVDGDGNGGGVALSSGVLATVMNTILAGNVDKGGQTPDCVGQFTSHGYNLIQQLAGCIVDGDTDTNKTGVAPRLSPLKYNGGPTRTHALLGDSPGVDAGNPATIGSGDATCLAKDQRSSARPVDGNADGTKRCDIGAVEYSGPVIIKLSPASRPAGSGAFTLTIRGVRFTKSSIVLWNGQQREPKFEDSTTLTLQIPGNQILKAQTVKVQALTPGATLTSGLSNTKLFTVTK